MIEEKKVTGKEPVILVGFVVVFHDRMYVVPLKLGSMGSREDFTFSDLMLCVPANRN